MRQLRSRTGEFSNFDPEFTLQPRQEAIFDEVIAVPSRTYSWIIDFWLSHRASIMFGFFLFLFFGMYRMTGMFTVGHSVFSIPYIDNAIPFIPLFVIPYCFFIPLLAIPLLLAYKDPQKFFALCAAFSVVSLTINLVFIFFPTMIQRPEIAATGFATHMVAAIYSLDFPFNCFPSGHVALTLFASFAMFSINKQWAKWMVLPTVLLVLSTVFIKQHYITDVVGGIVVAVLAYSFVFRKLLKE